MPDPDANLLVMFRQHANPNEAKSREAGRLICDDVDVIDIRRPGARDYATFPATSVSHWAVDPNTGGQIKITYAERFQRQYQQFKMQSAQTKSGTPLTHAPFLTEGRRAEMRALNIFTVEQLAHLDGQELKNIGTGGRELKNAAQAFIEDSLRSVPNLQLQAEIEALKAQNMVLQEDLEVLKNGKEEGEFKDMSLEQLRDYIATNTGHAPHGSYNRKTLLRMAMDARPEKAA